MAQLHPFSTATQMVTYPIGTISEQLACRRNSKKKKSGAVTLRIRDAARGGRAAMCGTTTSRVGDRARNPDGFTTSVGTRATWSSGRRTTHRPLPSPRSAAGGSRSAATTTLEEEVADPSGWRWVQQLPQVGLESGFAGTGDEFELIITVMDYPPGASKWNLIEHRMFSRLVTTGLESLW